MNVRAWVAAGVAAMIWTAFGAARLQRVGGDVSQFVVAGDVFTDPARAPRELSVLRNSAGYDGQFYYRLALEPFSTDEVAAGIHFDFPLYRQQRILYPLIVFLLSAGQPAIALWLMPIVNLLCIALLTWIAAEHLRLLNINPLWSIAVALYPGFLFTFSRNLGEIVEVTLVAAALLALRTNRHIVATLCLALAVLAKETALVSAIALGIYWLVRVIRRSPSRDVRLHTIITPFIAHFGWKALLAWMWDLPFSLGAGGVISMPLGGFMTAIQTSSQRFELFELAGLVVMFIVVLAAIVRSKPNVPSTVWLLYTLFVATLSHRIFIDDWAFMRSHTEWAVVGALVALSNGRYARWIATALMIAGWAATAHQFLTVR